MNLNDVSPCGIDCINCELFLTNKREDVWERVSKLTGLSIADVKCKGCRLQGGCSIHENCKTLACITSRGVDFCNECTDFPCEKLMPTKDGAERMPHNMKLYNLCRIRLKGLDQFLAESSNIRKKYFQGKLVIGEGPTLTMDDEAK